MQRVAFIFGVLALCGLSREPARASSVAAPANLGEMARESDAVVLARAGASFAKPGGRWIFTATTFAVERRLSGGLNPGDEITVRCPGGQVGQRAWLVDGAPKFTPGDAYLLFLRRQGGAWLPLTLSYGILRQTKGLDGSTILAPLREARRLRLVPAAGGARGGASAGAIVACRKEALLEHLGEVLAGRATWDTAQVVAPDHERVVAEVIPAGCVYIGDEISRWKLFADGGTAMIFADRDGDPSLTDGDVFGLIPEALDWWQSIPGTNLSLQYGGATNVNPGCTPNDTDLVAGVILFDDPCSDIPDLNNDCAGTLALGGPFTNGSHAFDGQVWKTIVNWTVLVNNGSGCQGRNGYRSLLAHELGHGLGFGHTADSNSIMFGLCCNTINETDETCARFTYPDPSEPVTNVACFCNVDGGVDLTWTNDSAALEKPISILVNGAQVASLPGTTESYTLLAEDLPTSLSDLCVRNGSGVPVCCEFTGEPDCNANGVPDDCDLASGNSQDCNLNGLPDSCDISSGTDPDCNGNAIPDSCDLDEGAADCNANGIPDACDLSSGFSKDCDGNSIPDSCDIAVGALDCNADDVPDTCELADNDCDANDIPDDCDLASGAPDCNVNDVPDACDLDAGSAADCNDNGIPDACEVGTEIPEACGRQLPGDLNQDGAVDVSDAVKLFGYLFAGDPPFLPCQDGLIDDPANVLVFDFNGDGGIDISDGITALSWLFSSGAPHVMGVDCIRVDGCEDACR